MAGPAATKTAQLFPLRLKILVKPGPRTVRLDDVFTLAGPGGGAGRVTADVGRLKVVRDLQAFRLGVREGELIKHGENEDRCDHREVDDEIANFLVCRRSL